MGVNCRAALNLNALSVPLQISVLDKFRSDSRIFSDDDLLIMLCTICYKSRRCEQTFREVALSLRYDYMLEEYSSLSDAWRVYQGVALYREYRGIGGVTTQLDVTPSPCHMCLVKIVNMAASVHQVTTSIHTGPVPSKSCDESDTETEIFSRRVKSSNVIVSEDSDDSHFTKNSDSQNVTSKLPPSRSRRPTGRSFLDRNPDFKVASEKDPDGKEESAADDEEDKPGPAVRERPRRSGGRSLFERNPDFALGSQFARILRQKGLREGKQKKRPEEVVEKRPSLQESSGQEEDSEEPPADWRRSSFRSAQLARLDKALSVAGWMPAIRNGRHLETEVFKTSSCKSEYESGINKLIEHFSRGSQSTSGKFSALLKPAGPSKRTVKPTRKILDGLDFRRKPRKKVKTTQSKSRSQLEIEHSNKFNNDEKHLMVNNKSSETPDIKDNVSICDSELSMSSHCTNDSYERSHTSKSTSRGRKKVSTTKESSAVPEPMCCDGKGEIKSESDVIYEASVSQKVNTSRCTELC